MRTSRGFPLPSGFHQRPANLQVLRRPLQSRPRGERNAAETLCEVRTRARLKWPRTITAVNEKRNIVLCGFMATGKTSVGKRLAALLGRDFVDLDSLIETGAGMSIPQIFASLGEPVFRAMEARMVRRVARRAGCVVAAGGGTIVDEKNLRELKRRGVIITLAANMETILARVGSTDGRPLLSGENKAERIRNLMEQRQQAYAKADMVIDTTSMSIDEVARHIIDRLQGHGAGQPEI